MPKLSKEQQKYINYTLALSNVDLVEEVILSQIPDSYDGIFTLNGQWQATKSIEILSDRLLKVNFINKPLFKDKENA